MARKFLNDPIIKVNHGISHYDDVTQDKSYQDKDTDFIVWKKNGKTFGLEAKVDSHNTGNFYLETSVDYFSMVPDALNEQRVARRYWDGIDPLWHTPGWVYRSGADQILYYFRTTQLLYIFSRVDVWFYAEKLMRGGIHLDPGIRKPKMYSAENISERNGSTLFFANGLCVNAEQTYKALGAQKESSNTRLKALIQTFQRSAFALSNYEFSLTIVKKSHFSLSEEYNCSRKREKA